MWLKHFEEGLDQHTRVLRVRIYELPNRLIRSSDELSRMHFGRTQRFRETC